MARSIIIVPMAIFVLMCIIAVLAFAPNINAPITDTQTMPLSEALENEGYYEVDPSEVVSGNLE